MVEAPPTTDPKPGVLDDCKTGLQKSFLKNTCISSLPRFRICWMYWGWRVFFQLYLVIHFSYSIRRESGRPGSEHDVHTNQYVTDMLQVLEYMLDPCGPAHPICSIIQLYLWTETFKTWRKVDCATSNEMFMRTDKNSAFPRSTPFWIFEIRLAFLQPPRNSLRNFNMSEQAVHIWKPCLDSDNRFWESGLLQSASLRHRAFVNQKRFFCILRKSITEKVFDREKALTKFGTGVMFQQGQKPKAVMRHKVRNIARSVARVHDHYKETEATAKVFLVELKHRKLSDCDNVSVHVEMIMPSLQETFPS